MDLAFECDGWPSWPLCGLLCLPTSDPPRTPLEEDNGVASKDYTFHEEAGFQAKCTLYRRDPFEANGTCPICRPAGAGDPWERGDPRLAPRAIVCRCSAPIGPRRCCGAGCFELDSMVATTAMRLVPALGSNPGLSPFLGQPWAGGHNAVGVGRARTQRRETSACSLGGLCVSA